jgi:predicted N-acetyltransferase YhbS
VIRDATERDVPRLRALMRESNGYESAAARAMIVAYAATWTMPADPDVVVRVLEDEGEPVAFHKIVPHPRGSELDLFFTDNARQGRGLGRRLFVDACETARSRGSKRLVIVSNPAAADFYRRMGARADGEQPASSTITWPRPRFVVEL